MVTIKKANDQLSLDKQWTLTSENEQEIKADMLAKLNPEDEIIVNGCKMRVDDLWSF